MAKYVVTVFSIVCDQCGNQIDGTTGDGCSETGYIHTMNDVKQMAKKNGWKTGTAKDLCPSCRKTF